MIMMVYTYMYANQYTHSYICTQHNTHIYHTYIHTRIHMHTHNTSIHMHAHTRTRTHVCAYNIITTVVSIAPGNLRLRGGHHPYEGRVEIFLNDQWGTICDDGWSIQDAKVTCRQLGFSGSVMAVHGGYYGTGDGEIWLDEVRCTGQESSLLTCENHMIDGQHDCSHDQDAGVVCLSKQSVAMVIAL